MVYEHFGGKEGLYAVVVDREMRALTEALSSALATPSDHPRQIVERTALALLTYIEENAEGFQVLVRDSPSTDPAGSFSSLLGEVSMKVEELLVVSFKQRKLPTKGVPYYAQMLVGMTVFTGQYWAGPAQNQQGTVGRAYRQSGVAWPVTAGGQAHAAVRGGQGPSATPCRPRVARRPPSSPSNR